MSRAVEEWIGHRFGSLVVTAITRLQPRRGTFVVCKCDCGTEKTVYLGHLKAGMTRTCGKCKRTGPKTHGMSHTPEYRAWESARSRCRNPNNRKFPIYGARGISMCERWASSFSNFFEDMGRRPLGLTLDRINSNGNYEPGNCRWATYTVQNNNRPGYNLHLRGNPNG